MIRDKSSGFLPVGFIDDDDRKRNLRVNNHQVLGKRADLDAIIVQEQIEVVVIAIAQVEGKALREIDEKCQEHNVVLRVIPRLSEIVAGTVHLGDMSTVTEEDLLGRRPVDTDEESIAFLIKNMRVLVTGAGGSIGSELTRQIARYGPSKLILLDRDESALHSVQMSLDGRGLLDSDDLVLADIRDGDYITEVLQLHRPDIVFHAAALKHLTLLERNPYEAEKTNVAGTRNVLRAAYASGVSTFINISTDKAADPTSVLGRSKRRTEEITSQMPASLKDGTPTRYLSVRFGNVLGSRGSFLTTFRFQIEQGGPVTVTHPEVSRYFMTIPEAVHLVLQASRIGRPGDVLVLDMGDPVKIADVARHMIRKSGKSVSVEYTGLRAGEKLHEDLVGRDEILEKSEHPLIHRISRSLEQSGIGPDESSPEVVKGPVTFGYQRPGPKSGGA
jgi:dTDP-glucose 4,6-dehydratase